MATLTSFFTTSTRPIRVSNSWTFDVSGKHLRGGQAELVAARLRATPHGPIANRLWRYIAEKVSVLAEAIG
jgi:hypothetical protein